MTVFSPVRVLAEMAAPAGEVFGRRLPDLGRLALVAADHGVAEVVPVAVGALEAGRRVDVVVGVALGLPSLGETEWQARQRSSAGL